MLSFVGRPLMNGLKIAMARDPSKLKGDLSFLGVDCGVNFVIPMLRRKLPSLLYGSV